MTPSSYRMIEPVLAPLRDSELAWLNTNRVGYVAKCEGAFRRMLEQVERAGWITITDTRSSAGTGCSWKLTELGFERLSEWLDTKGL